MSEHTDRLHRLWSNAVGTEGYDGGHDKEEWKRLQAHIEEADRHNLALAQMRGALGEIFQLFDEGMIVRNTEHDGDFSTFMAESNRLVKVLSQAKAAFSASPADGPVVIVEKCWDAVIESAAHVKIDSIPMIEWTGLMNALRDGYDKILLRPNGTHEAKA